MTAMSIDIAPRHMVGWTRPSAEFGAAAALRELGFDAFVPAVRLRRPIKCWSRNRGHGKTRDQIIVEPAFRRYIVFSTTSTQVVWQRAMKADGMTVIIRLAGKPDLPAELGPQELALLRGPMGDGVIEDKSGLVQALYEAGQRVKVMMASVPIPGVVVGHEGRDIRVLLSVLGGHREATVAFDSVSAA